ncbi:MAG: class I SAM-dependent methyltransferase [Halobacteria archaeon]
MPSRGIPEPDEKEHPWFAAAYDVINYLPERMFFGKYRDRMVDGLEGRVLDIGCGTGAMFPYYAERNSRFVETEGCSVSSRRLELHAVEPEPNMLGKARRRAQDLQLDIQFVRGVGEGLPYRDGSFDHVLTPLVLCSVDDLDICFAEIHRVLADGGQLRIFEHVGSAGWMRSLQESIQPFWGRVAGGCHLDRDTLDELASSDYFDVDEAYRINTGFPPVEPFVFAELTKSSRM